MLSEGAGADGRGCTESRHWRTSSVSCGPGAEHVTGDVEPWDRLPSGWYGTSPSARPGPDVHHPTAVENSAHADRTAHAFWYPIGEDHRDCVACHTGGGYIDAAKGLPPEERRTDYQPITCAVCHDPHHADRPDQLRVFDEVVLPDGTNVTEAGPAATCMTCHNTRVDPVRAVEGSRFQTPHYSAAAGLSQDRRLYLGKAAEHAALADP